MLHHIALAVQSSPQDTSTAHLCNPAGGYISWGIDSPTDTSLFLTTYRGGSHLPADIYS